VRRLGGLGGWEERTGRTDAAAAAAVAAAVLNRVSVCWRVCRAGWRKVCGTGREEAWAPRIGGVAEVVEVVEVVGLSEWGRGGRGGGLFACVVVRGSRG